MQAVAIGSLRRAMRNSASGVYMGIALAGRSLHDFKDVSEHLPALQDAIRAYALPIY